MKAAFCRRLELLEARRGNAARRVHIITANNANQQMAILVTAGATGDRDGFLCLTGKPLAH
ncbi:hypothetical protein [Bradyrhizobium sp. McL0616]|uniref:hypothetical protein n=1 Tax=Bradyrhizobium sp. McL0616 TaxID=3415674 RepID=UPI003CF7BA79